MLLKSFLQLSLLFVLAGAIDLKPGIILVGDSTVKWDGGWGIPGYAAVLNNATLKLFADYGVSGVRISWVAILFFINKNCRQQPRRGKQAQNIL